ncbi:phosphatidylserine decarboxylase [Bacillus suaedae]|uniref:phosphatidylserine decarboxylase n=1 Tax=Halalkalibacter suaedae TaxID=2822140 RepID=A0A940WRV4_9BACI|nr:phosphatidylserine decarboxylase [Bacillus suaedae]MBP3951350.1 phosphatidylserine decarboxylase [Bacillus suaedae]
MKKLFFQSCVQLTNHRLSSQLLKGFTNSKLSAFTVPSYAKVFNIDQTEMAKSLHEYKTLHELFTRELKLDARVIDQDSNSIVSPVDGIISQSGKLMDGTTFHVKGQNYCIKEMLGSSEKKERYKNGSYLIVYLSPSHYHRIHSPINGQIVNQWELGKRSYPVNRMGLVYGQRPLSKNYRVITEIAADGKQLAVVKIGAMNINTIELTHKGKDIKKGQELGYFSFGSTVILLTEKNFVHFDNLEQEIKMGQSIGWFE